MIQVQNLTKNFGNITAVNNISFKVDGNQIVGLLGQNGAGKTTTMRMLTTFIRPTSGQISVAGFDIEKDADKIRDNIGFLPENPPLYPELTVNENLLFVGRLRKIPEEKLLDRISEVIELCALHDYRDRACGVLSKGYKQRVGLAQAILHNPQVIILDEPTSGLDPLQIIQIRKLIKKLGEDHLVILSSHILQEISEICSHVLIMAQGRVLANAELGEFTQGRGLEEKFLEIVCSV